MSYSSVVLVKQVPDTANITGKAMKDDGTVNRAALPAIMNPEDLNALSRIYFEDPADIARHAALEALLALGAAGLLAYRRRQRKQEKKTSLKG